jgi:hypothetical protein
MALEAAVRATQRAGDTLSIDIITTSRHPEYRRQAEEVLERSD